MMLRRAGLGLLVGAVLMASSGASAGPALVFEPYSGTVWRTDAPGASGLTPPTDTRDRWKADLNIVTPGYFGALRVPFLRGRNYTSSDCFQMHH